MVTQLGRSLRVALAGWALAAFAVHAQNTPAKPPSSASAPGAVSTAATSWTPPRTAWGDPDLQGNFSTIQEANTPLERPDNEFVGKRREEITAEDLAAASKARNERIIKNYTGQPPQHWFDNLANNNSRPWFVIDPPDGKIPPLTEGARKRRPTRFDEIDAATYLDMGNYVRCITSGPPVSKIIPTFFGNSYQILQTKDYVAIRYEVFHETQIIPLEGRGAARPHNSPKLRSYFGDAIGRWDGNTLVVDTTNFHETIEFHGSAGPTLHTIERFTRTAPHTVEYVATLDDPHTWTRPWTFAIPMTEDDGQQIFEYACHEGNMGIRNALSAARAKDAKEQTK